MELATEFKLLAKFVLACQSPKISQTAADHGLTTSALSTALKTLEGRAGMKLFTRQGGQIGLLPPAFWLYREACELLQLEYRARQVATRSTQPLERLVVNIDLSFAIGRFSRALERVVLRMGEFWPHLLIDCQFADVGGRQSEVTVGSHERIAADPRAWIDIFYVPEDGTEDSGFFGVVHVDPWVAVSGTAHEAPPDITTDPVAVTRLRPVLLGTINDYLEARGAGNRLRQVNADARDLGQILFDNPHLRFLMPASMLAARMGLSPAEAIPLDPPLVSPIGARITGFPFEQAETFLLLLREALESSEENVVFEPQLTMRQIQLFNLACRSGSISAAARVANLSQPSVSAQIQKIEGAVGSPLFSRRSDGAQMTETGGRLLPFSLEIEGREAALVRLLHDLAAHTQAVVSVGMLPSSGHDSVLTARVADMVAQIHTNLPNLHLEVIEASNSILNERVRSGMLNLAIVGIPGPKVGRIVLGPGEPLAVAANPAIEFGDRSTLTLEEVCELPLVMGSHHLSIHQSVMAAVRARHLRLRSVIEVGSLSLAIAIARRVPVCTVLPASSVRRYAEEGSLKVLPIAAENISGQILVIFSMDRALSTAERAIIQALIASFAGDPPEQDSKRNADSVLPDNR